MTDYLIRLSCPTCPPGTVMEHVADGTPGRVQTQVMCRCGGCKQQYRLVVRLAHLIGEACTITALESRVA